MLEYDDDDYYYEQQEQERLRKEAEAARQKAAAAKLRTKANATTKKTTGVSLNINTKKKAVTIAKNEITGVQQVPVQGPSQSEQNEKERLVVSMGFSSDKAKFALQKHKWDVQAAINDLLSNPNMGGSESGGGTMAPPPGLGPSKPKAKSSTSEKATASLGGIGGVKGIMAPPPGMAKPKSQSQALPSVGGVKGVMAPPPGMTKPNAATASKISTVDKKIKSSSASSQPVTSSERLKKEKVSMESTMKKISPAMQEKMKALKSRLTMVILGHVDAGKSTLMGQVLVQMGKVEKRTVSKYAKQAGEIGKASFALAWVMDEDESERER